MANNGYSLVTEKIKVKKNVFCVSVVNRRSE